MKIFKEGMMMRNNFIKNELELNQTIINHLKCVLIIFIKEDLPSDRALASLSKLIENKYHDIKLGFISIPNPLFHRRLQAMHIEEVPTFISFYKGMEFERFSGTLIDSINGLLSNLNNQGYVSLKR